MSIIKFQQSDAGAVRVSVVAEYHCTGCEYFDREYEDNDIRCKCRNSQYYLDVPPGEPCNHWRPKE